MNMTTTEAKNIVKDKVKSCLDKIDNKTPMPLSSVYAILIYQLQREMANANRQQETPHG